MGWSYRGTLLKDLGRTQEAAQSFQRALAHGGAPELNGYFLASLTGGPAPATAPRHYVEDLFDGYAANFDEHLVGVLNYRAPQVLAEHMPARTFEHALDLGCGTGLCGPLLKPMARRTDGVDLSRKMLDRAAALGVYNQLAQADIVQYLRDTGERYDLVISADVFIYVGDLEPVFAGVARVMAAGGLFCLSSERARDGKDFELRTSQRYAQSERYLRELAGRHGFEVLNTLRQPLREDQRQPVEGLFVYLERR